MSNKYCSQKQALNAVSKLFWVASIVLCVITFVFAVQSLDWPLLWDAARVHYVSMIIADGGAPYRDVFDTDLPGTYLLHLLILKTIGGGDFAWRLFDFACLICINGLVFLYCRKFGVLSSLLAVCLFSAFHLYNGPLYMGQRDYYLVFFIISGMWFAARYVENGFRLHNFALSGFILGAGCTIKPHLGILMLFINCICLVFAFRARTRWIVHGLLFFVCACIAPCLILYWLFVLGALESFFDIVFNYLLPFYSKFEYHPVSSLLSRKILGVPIVIDITLVFIASTAICLWERVINIRRLFLVAGIFYGVIHFLSQGHSDYHFYPALFCMFLCATSWLAVIKYRYFTLPSLIMILVLTHLVFGTTAIVAKSIIKKPPHHITHFICVNDLVGDLEGKVSRSERVQVMDFMSGGIHALYKLHYKQSTRFIYDFHFFHDTHHPYIQGLRKEFLNSLQSNPPVFFVLTKVSWPFQGYERLNKFPELCNWLSANYVLYASREYYRLYIRKNR